MSLDHRVLANLDRRLLAKLDRDERFQMVRLPVSPAKWSTWKRYCGAAEISMGRAIVALIDRELASVAETSIDDSPVLAQRACQRLAIREAEVETRERAVSSADERLRISSQRLGRWESELEERERRVELAFQVIAQYQNTDPKLGRNERCPCRSGLKYKHCHGLPARPPNTVPR